MTGVRKLQDGELIALPRPGETRAGVGVSARAQTLAAADLNNVVPFQRPRAAAPHAPDVVLPSDAARLPSTRPARERARLLGFAALSLLVHGGLFAAFWREPVPLASIGVEVMSIEIVIGATAPAGIAQTPGEQQVQAAAAIDPTPAEPEQQAEQKATQQPQTVAVAPEERAPERAVVERSDQKLAEAQAAAEREPARTEPRPSVAMVESPKPDTATAAPREIPPEATELSLLPQPEEKPAEPELEPKPVQAEPPKAVKNVAPAREPRRIAAPTRDQSAKQAMASTPSTAANNVGVGRSDHDTNYAGVVSAHLRRHQQYPADARSRGDQGTATVTFSLDSGGRVTSARLARGSGIASIDGEVQAMVRRASPFRHRPGGRGEASRFRSHFV